MTKSSLRIFAGHHQRSNAKTAAALSIVSGLGQIYNGQKRKGYLFLAVLFLQIQSLLWYHFNKQVFFELHIGVAYWQAACSLLVFSIAYAMQDAYSFANAKTKQKINAKSVLEFSEAASVSFLIHYVSFLGLLLFSVFVLKPAIHRNETTEIQFIQHQRMTKEKVHAHVRSFNPSKDSGEHKSKPIEAPSSSSAHQRTNSTEAPAHSIVKVSPKNLPKPVVQILPKPIAPAEIARPKSTRQALQPVALPQPTRESQVRPPHRLPMIKPTNKVQHSDASASAPQPLKLPNSIVDATVNPRPMFARSQGVTDMPMPKAKANYPGELVSPPSPIPVTSSSVSSGTNLAPRVVSSSNLSPYETVERKGAPLPSKSIGANRPSVSMLPQIPFTGAKSDTVDYNGSGENALGNPAKNSDPRAQPSQAAEAADFSFYMTELQRRIKRAWYPSSDVQSQRVVVVFRISKSGELSDLHLQHPSGKPSADRAALQAVENAAPFAHLPKGADESVDIQFTFDYNVFSGGKEFFRNF